MTVAVCLNCGELKHGAFNPCQKCGYTPEDDESLTKHLLVTDHYHSRDMLENIADRVKSGEPITFDLETLKAAWVSKAALDEEAKRIRNSCLIVFVVLLALVVVIVAVLMWWL